MNKTPYEDIVEIADTHGVEAAILLTSCESESDVEWARTFLLFEECRESINMAEYTVPAYNKKLLYYSLPSFEIKSIPGKIVITGNIV